MLLTTLASLLILSSLVIAQSGLVSHWEFEQNVNDSVGINHGTRYNFTNGWVTGKYGYALEFNRSAEQYVNMGNDSSLTFGTGDFSLEAWFKTSGFPSASMEIFFKIQYDTDNPLYELAIYTGTGNLYFWTWNGKNPPNDCEGNMDFFPDDWDNNQWHHVVGVRKDNWNYLYYDGELVEDAQEINITDSQPCPVNVDHPFDLVIGADYLGMAHFWHGAIDNPRVWDRALTGDEVENIYKYNSLTPPVHISLLQLLLPILTSFGVILYVVRRMFASEEISIEDFIKIVITILISITLTVFLIGFL